MLRFVATVFSIAFVLGGCSGDDSAPYGSGAPSSTTSGQPASAALNGCTSYVDGDTIAWTMSARPPATCLRIKKGGTVTWNGDLGSHPLAPKGGDSATPISTVSSGSAKAFTFDAPGTYGFVCTVHGSMTGAILVE